jgi:hypothetical protein
MGARGLANPRFQLGELGDRRAAFLPRGRSVLRQCFALLQRRADGLVRFEDAGLEPGEVLRGVGQGLRQVLLRMLGTGPDQLEQAHAVVGQAGDQLTVGLDFGPRLGKARSQPGGGLLQGAPGFAAL